MPQQVWKIRGYDGGEPIFERIIAVGAISEKDMTTLLQRLASRHLTDDEVVSASLRKNADGYAPHLEILSNKGGAPGLMTTGSGHHYTAIVEDVE